MEIKYMEDCIHLHACRRLQRIIEARGFTRTGRQCNENCSAYQGGETDIYLTPEQAMEVARDGFNMAQMGYEFYDSFTTSDFANAGSKGILAECD